MRSWLSRHRLTLYVSIVVIAGTAATLGSLHVLVLNGVQWRWWVLVLLTLVSGTAVLKIPGTPANFTISDTFTITAAVLYGPAAGTIAVSTPGPAIPTGLTATGGTRQISLAWTASAAPCSRSIRPSSHSMDSGP